MGICQAAIINRRHGSKCAPAGGLSEGTGGLYVRSSETQGMFVSDPTLAERLEEFLPGFREDFRRREQAEWATVYLQGLLQPGGRKTIENLARTVSVPNSLRADDVAQALQHFINQSPWDERKIYRRYHRCLAERLNAVSGVFVLDEFAFVKQGRHSVGVQRQYSAGLACKVNCQIAVALYHRSAAGFLPLNLRLYLPRRWLEDEQRLKAAGVPPEARRLTSKTLLALELIEEARAAGISTKEIVCGIAWGKTEELANFAPERGLNWRSEPVSVWVDDLSPVREELQHELGLDHFEGRSWRGLHHHACLVMLAYALLALRREEAVKTD